MRGDFLAEAGSRWYKRLMAKDAYLSPSEVDAAQRRRLEAMQLQAIEGNPLSAEQVAMFEMFEREAWPHARRRAHILARVIPLAAE